MKLTKQEKSDLKLFKNQNPQVKFITVQGVVTIAWSRAWDGSKMILVATSYFDQTEDDRFRRTTGEYYAAIRLSNGGFMQLPLGEYTDDEITDMLEDMFCI